MVSSAWSARSKMLMTRAIEKVSLASWQSSARFVSSVFCIVSAEMAEPEPAAPDLAYCWKMDESSGKYLPKSMKTPSSHMG